MAAALLESEEARTFLPSITGLIGCPVIVSTHGGVQIVGQGYHPDTGLFITGGQTPPQIELSEAVAALQELLSEFDFQSPGDRSRALASFITPALKLGGHLHRQRASGRGGSRQIAIGQNVSAKTRRRRLQRDAIFGDAP